MANIQERLNTNHNNIISRHIISYWIHVTKIIKAVFNNKFISNKYEKLQQCLKEELEILLKVWS